MSLANREMQPEPRRLTLVGGDVSSEGVDVLADELLGWGVRVLSRGKRRDLAANLLRWGVGMEELEALGQFVLRSCGGNGAKAAGYLAVLLESQQRTTEALEDVARHEALSARKRRTPEHYWGFPYPHPTCECARCVTLRKAKEAAK